MALTVRPNTDDTLPLEAEVLRPDLMAASSTAELGKLPVYHGNRQRPLDACFNLSGDPSDGCLLLEGDFSRVKSIGQSMESGQITIHGNAGMHLGAEMRGGSIRVHGDAGDWVGAEMRGGSVHIHGNAGHLAGGSYRGSRAGMRGGIIVIDGNGGNEIGCGMRRGLIAVGKGVGDFAGFNMIAGSIIVCGRFGIRCGAGMQRGTIVALGQRHDQPVLLSSFRYACTYRPQFLGLYLRKLAAWGFAADPQAVSGSFDRFSGDLVALGKGEVLLMDH